MYRAIFLLTFILVTLSQANAYTQVLKPDLNFNKALLDDSYFDVIKNENFSKNQVQITTPQSVFNGQSVSVSIKVTPIDDVNSGTLWIFADKNPSPTVAYIQFHQKQASYQLTTSIRLKKSSKVYAVFISDNVMLVNANQVDVVASGIKHDDYCKREKKAKDTGKDATKLSRLEVKMITNCGEKQEILTKSTKAIVKQGSKNSLIVKVLALSEMLPNNAITRLNVKVEDQSAVTVRLTSNISKNPYFSFEIQGKEQSDLHVEVTNVSGSKDSLTLTTK